MGAEDVVSDVFVKVFNGLYGYDRKKSSVSTWIYTIVRGVCGIYSYRQKNRQRSVLKIVFHNHSPSKRPLFIITRRAFQNGTLTVFLPVRIDSANAADTEAKLFDLVEKVFKRLFVQQCLVNIILGAQIARKLANRFCRFVMVYNGIMCYRGTPRG